MNEDPTTVLDSSDGRSVMFCDKRLVTNYGHMSPHNHCVTPHMTRPVTVMHHESDTLMGEL